MKKQKKRLLFLLIALAVCVAAYIGIRFWKSVTEARNQEAETVHVLEIASGDITGYSFEIEGENYRFDRKGSGWICENDPSLDLDDTVMDVKAGYLENLTAKQQISEKENIADMGLEEPEGRVTIYTADREYEILLGNYNWLLTGYYISYEDRIYLIRADFYTAFTCSLESMISGAGGDTENTETMETEVLETETENFETEISETEPAEIETAEAGKLS